MSLLGSPSGHHFTPDISVCQTGFLSGTSARPWLRDLRVVLVHADDVERGPRRRILVKPVAVVVSVACGASGAGPREAALQRVRARACPPVPNSRPSVGPDVQPLRCFGRDHLDRRLALSFGPTDLEERHHLVGRVERRVVVAVARLGRAARREIGLVLRRHGVRDRRPRRLHLGRERRDRVRPRRGAPVSGVRRFCVAPVLADFQLAGGLQIDPMMDLTPRAFALVMSCQRRCH